MITEERISAYLRSLVRPKSVFLEQLRAEAEQEGVPIIRLEEEALLAFLAELLKPENVLEVGTGVAYSTLFLLSQLPETSAVTTIENYPPRIEKARLHIEAAGQTDRVLLLAGDAGEILKTLSGPYGLIFMDAAKAQYLTWLPEILRLLPPGGVLVSDNVLQDGDVLESRFNVRRRDRTIHKRMRAYLHELTHREDLTTSVLPVGDGIAVTLRRTGDGKEETGGTADAG